MKLYVSCDMEGVAGVTSWQQVDARTPHPEYLIYRGYYTREVAAAIEGARLAGPAEVLVNDSHGPMRNLLFDELPPDVRVLFGNRKPFSMVQDADATFGGAFFVGYHGGAGDADAVLCHTYTPSVVYEVRVNGVRCSEAILNAGLLGHFGIPLLLITGDRTTVDGARAILPWVHGVVVKESIGTFAAASMTPEAARAAIREGARAAVESAATARPYRFEVADRTRGRCGEDRAGRSRGDDPGFPAHRRPKRSFRPRRLSDDFQGVRRDLAARRTSVKRWIAAFAAIALCAATPVRHAALPRGFVYLSDVAPSIVQDIRYAGPHNLVGRALPGYLAPVCILTERAAFALAKAQEELTAAGLTLRVYDCYQPQRAANALLRLEQKTRRTNE